MCHAGVWIPRGFGYNCFSPHRACPPSPCGEAKDKAVSLQGTVQPGVGPEAGAACQRHLVIALCVVSTHDKLHALVLLAASSRAGKLAICAQVVLTNKCTQRGALCSCTGKPCSNRQRLCVRLQNTLAVQCVPGAHLVQVMGVDDRHVLSLGWRMHLGQHLCRKGLSHLGQ